MALKIFFRRIEVVGLHNVPVRAPAIFILNHPNGLVDPLFILAFGPENVSFMAKEPLFRTPVVKHFVKAFGCLPVYRRQDGSNPRQNIESMAAARDLLARNASLALFPEGTTHDEPALQPLKTGAARIALSARAMIAANTPAKTPVRLVPVGLYYPSKSTFRSDAVMVYGAAVDVPLVTFDNSTPPPRDAVRDLTTRIDGELRALTVNARDPEHVALAATAARLLEETASVALHPDVKGPVHRRLVLMQRILAHHDAISDDATPELATLIARLRNYQTTMNRHGLGERVPAQIGLFEAARHLGKTLLGMALGMPFVLVGVLENWLPYHVIGLLAHRAARGSEEIVSTLKMLAGLLLFPITWLAVSVGVLMITNWTWALAHLVAAPLCARAALWFCDRSAVTVDGARALWLIWARRHKHTKLIAERDAIVEQLLGAVPGEPG